MKFIFATSLNRLHYSLCIQKNLTPQVTEHGNQSTSQWKCDLVTFSEHPEPSPPHAPHLSITLFDHTSPSQPKRC